MRIEASTKNIKKDNFPDTMQWILDPLTKLGSQSSRDTVH